MCREMDKIYNEGSTAGAKREQVKVALNMIADHVPSDKVAKYSELSISEVRELEEWRKGRESLQPA